MQQSSRGSNTNILSENLNFLPSTNFELLSQIKYISRNDRSICKFIIFLRVGLCDYLLWMTVNLAAPLPDTSCVYDAGCMIFMLYDAGCMIFMLYGAGCMIFMRYDAGCLIFMLCAGGMIFMLYDAGRMIFMLYDAGRMIFMLYDAGRMIFILYASQLNFLCNIFLHCKMLSLE
jgi:hypothetical protein